MEKIILQVRDTFGKKYEVALIPKEEAIASLQARAALEKGIEELGCWAAGGEAHLVWDARDGGFHVENGESIQNGHLISVAHVPQEWGGETGEPAEWVEYWMENQSEGAVDEALEDLDRIYG